MPRFSEYAELTVLDGTELFAVTNVPGVVGGTVYIKASNVRTYMQEGFVGGGGGTSNVAVLDDLTDVSLATRASGQILRYNGTAWVNVPGLTFFEAAGAASAAQSAAATDATTKVNAHAALTTSVHGIPDTAQLYRVGGTDVAIADGGTGASTAPLARAALGLAIGSDVQAYNSKLAAIGALNPAQGDILYYNGTAWVLLPAGSAGQVLSTGGAGANPTWSTTSADPTIPGRVTTLENSGVTDESHSGAVTSNTASEFSVNSFAADATRAMAIGDRIFCQWDYLIWNASGASMNLTIRIKEGTTSNRIQWQAIPIPSAANASRVVSIGLVITNRNNPAPGDGVDKSSWAATMIIGGEQAGTGGVGSSANVAAGQDTVPALWQGYSDGTMLTTMPQIDVRMLFSVASASIGVKKLGAMRQFYKDV